MGTPLDFAISLAQQTGDLLLSHYHSSCLITKLKADGSFLTEADIAANHLITTSIQSCYPGDLLLSEEHPAAFSQNELEADRCVWLIDPLDGTTNFSLGLPIWGVILTRLAGGFPEIAVSYFPILGELYSAQRGRGVFLNNAHLLIETDYSKRKLSFFSCCSRTHQDYQVNIPYKTRIMGSAGYSMCTVAKGIAIVAFEATPKIWDIAAGWLMVKEAGGVIETLDFSHPFPLQPGLDYSHRDYPTLAAANRKVMDRARTQIIPK